MELRKTTVCQEKAEEEDADEKDDGYDEEEEDTVHVQTNIMVFRTPDGSTSYILV